ncbi:nitrate transport protein, NrtC-like protein [Aphanothece hegewaldii CCALA 016]|uniref:Nitrate transport protein, NrtC-like protein n=1 Tax=Aphanothece hegewaldii CCALA 016 TaxID=2107694 RepID=A0A2T1LQP7_9CHRO|nr:CmpA/NrtA family ABC transporter substrate-binding protein [Aphanothece hegewaldii]PSF29358.1 nitrate transport protein, NrtC-like protein [Aphanothece hegewaldii CCALA 016]
MKRRKFVKYTSLSSASLIIASCSGVQLPQTNTEEDFKLDSSKLEKKSLSLAYVPSTDAAPIIIAKEKGIFERYGLAVGLQRQNSWSEIEKRLLDGKVDTAQGLFAMPMLAQLGKEKAPMISLMMLNWNGSAITLGKKAWKGGLRPASEYQNFLEFSNNFRDYTRSTGQPLNFATESAASMDTYLLRYWLGAMGIDPKKEVKLLSINPSQLIYKLQAGTIDGFSVAEPWNQQTVAQQIGFIPYISKDIWRGHPGKILASMQGWIDKYPNTARTLVAALIDACRFCDKSENRLEIAQILSQSQYLNIPQPLIETSLVDKYLSENWENFQNETFKYPDFNLYHFQNTDYLKKPDHVNYPWRSHSVWLLTQLVRWNELGLTEYPKDADQILDKMYPVKIYEDAAEILRIEIPKQARIEPKTSFIDQREFDPSQPIAYLNQFEIRTT